MRQILRLQKKKEKGNPESGKNTEHADGDKTTNPPGGDGEQSGGDGEQPPGAVELAQNSKDPNEYLEKIRAEGIPIPDALGELRDALSSSTDHSLSRTCTS